MIVKTEEDETLLLVNLMRVEDALFDDNVIVALEFAEETTRISLVTSGSAHLLNF